MYLPEGRHPFGLSTLKGYRPVGKKEEQHLADKVKRLEWEITVLRQELRAVAPVQFEEILNPCGRLPKDFNPYDWPSNIATQIITRAVPLLDAPDRAPCPLCNHHPDQHDGYALPNGLERHLTGRLGQRQCSVMKAAHILIKEDWNYQRSHPPESE
jgi:hypothetical protein